MSLRRRDLLPLAAFPFASPAAVPALDEPHFPSRLHLFVWRNWELANLDRLAKLLGASPRKVEALGRSLGLPRKISLTADQLRRLYITVIRQNWHVLPNPQIIELLGWDEARFAFTLKEDDFLDVKLQAKPALPPLSWHAPTAPEQARAAEIRRIVRQVFGPAIDLPGQPPSPSSGNFPNPAASRPPPARARPSGPPATSTRTAPSTATPSSNPKPTPSPMGCSNASPPPASTASGCRPS